MATRPQRSVSAVSLRAAPSSLDSHPGQKRANAALYKLLWAIEQRQTTTFIKQLEELTEIFAAHAILPVRQQLHQTAGEILGHAITAER